MGKELPHRWSENNFRRYESILTTLLTTYPLDLFVNPFPYAPETVRCRMADAARAFIHNRWPSSCDAEKLEQIWPLVHTSLADDRVHLVIHPSRQPYAKLPISTSTIMRVCEPTDTLATPSVPLGLTIDNPSVYILSALFALHDSNHIPTPTKLTNLSDDAQNYIKTQSEFLNIGYMFTDPVTALIS